MKTTRSLARVEGVTSFPAHRTQPLAAGGKRPSALRPARWRSSMVEDSQSPFIFFGGALSPAELAFLPLPMARNGRRRLDRLENARKKMKKNGSRSELRRRFRHLSSQQQVIVAIECAVVPLTPHRAVHVSVRN